MFWNRAKSSKFDNSSEMNTSMKILSDLSKMRYNSSCTLRINPGQYACDIEGHITICGSAKSCEKIFKEDSEATNSVKFDISNLASCSKAYDSIKKETNEKLAKLLLDNEQPESYVFSNLKEMLKFSGGSDMVIDYPIVVLKPDDRNNRSSFLKALLKNCSDRFSNCSTNVAGDYATIRFTSRN